MDNNQIKKALTEHESDAPYREEDLLSTGCSLLNLALTGNIKGGFVKGKYFFFAGDSSSGKTFLSLGMLAEASINPRFDDYRLIHDDVEGGALMDLQRYFGSKVAKRLEPPAGTRDRPIYSECVEDFYCHVDDAFDNEEPFIYILDSQDALYSQYAEKKFKELKTSIEKGTVAKGDYGDGKAKTHSGRLRKVCSDLRKSGSILIIINQTRDNIDGGMFSPATTYSGGRALRFYACAQIWSSTLGKLKKTVRGKERQIGITAKVTVKKNRLTGKEWAVNVPIYYSHGVDDTGACVDFLIAEKHWQKKRGGTITASDFQGIQGYREDIIRQIESADLVDELKSIVEEVWKSIESDCAITRRRRYD